MVDMEDKKMVEEFYSLLENRNSYQAQLKSIKIRDKGLRPVDIGTECSVEVADHGKERKKQRRPRKLATLSPFFFFLSTFSSHGQSLVESCSGLTDRILLFTVLRNVKNIETHLVCLQKGFFYNTYKNGVKGRRRC